MLRDRRIPDIFLGAILAIAIFALGFSVALSFYPLHQNGRAQTAEQKNNTAPSDDRLADYTLALDFLNAFLVLSTVGLWWATRRSAGVAERALTELESPFIGLKITEPRIAAIWRGPEAYEIRKTYNGLTFCFVNHGRTPAVLLESEDKLQICPDKESPLLQWQPKYKSVYSYGVLIGPEKESADSFRLFDDFFDRDEFMTFSDGDRRLFLVGRLKYRDIFNGNFEMGFCAVFDHHRSRFMMEGGDAYNYCRKIS
jgi:hypothetical protein